MPGSDEYLVKKIQNSNTSAFKTLYMRYYERLYYFAYRRTDSEETARDLIHDLFASVWQARKELVIHSSCKAYLFGAAHNLIINYRKKQSHEISFQKQNAAPKLPSATDSAEFMACLHIAIDNLPEEIKTTFMMSRFEGLRYAEIAEILGISVKTVESRMSKAFKRLRNELKD